MFAVASTPSALGQTFTTVTNVLTTTGFFTSTVYSTNIIGTTTQTIVSTNTLVSTTDSLWIQMNKCWFDDWNITIDPGTTALIGTIGPPSTIVDFYIMNRQQYASFNHSDCGSTPYEAEVAVYRLTTYSLNWQNPPPGWYYLIFALDRQAPASMTVTTPFTLEATSNQEQTSTVYNVVTNQLALTSTQTVSSTQVTQVATGLSFGVDPTLIGAIVVVVIVILAALYFVRSRPKVKESRTTSSLSDRQFCLNCGKPLPAGSKFCNKCGTAQE